MAVRHTFSDNVCTGWLLCTIESIVYNSLAHNAHNIEFWNSCTHFIP